MSQELLDTTLKPVISAFIARDDEESQRLVEYVESSIEFCNIIDDFRLQYEYSRKLNKDRFNVFSCLTRHHLEELHSNFIYYLLNPNETHDCGDLFLKEFVEQIIVTVAPDALSAAMSGPLLQARVEREHYCGIIDGIRTFIDIYIECPTFIIAIENKINAGEQPDQITRYSKYCIQKDVSYFILYLTKFGDKSITAGKEPYTPISYDVHIRKWMEQAIKHSASYPIVKTGLKFYLDLLNEKILLQPPNTIIMKMKDLLLEPDNLHLLKHMKEFTSALTQIRNDLRVNFFRLLSDKLSEMNLDFRPVSRILTPLSVNKIWDNKNQGFTCFAPELGIQISPNAKVYFCIEHDWRSLWYGLFVVNTNTKTGQNGNGYAQVGRIKEIMAIRLKDLELTDEWWFCTQYFNWEGHSFGDDDLSYSLAIQPELPLVEFMKELGEYIHVWRATVEQYNEESAKKPL